MKNISIRVTDYILKKGIVEREDYKIYQYGIQVIMEVMISTITCFVISLYLNMILECILFFLIFIPLRSYAGGIHCEKYMSCFVCSCLTITTVLVLAKYISVSYIISGIIYLICLLLIKKLKIVVTEDRISDEEERQQLERKLNITLSLISLAACIFYILGNGYYLFLITETMCLVLASMILGKIKYERN